MDSENVLSYIEFLNIRFDFDGINRFSNELPDAPEWVWWLFVLEAVIIVFGGFLTALSLTILYKRPLFHKNLQTLIVSIFFVWTIMHLSRFVICLAAIFFDKGIMKNMFLLLVKSPFIYLEEIRIGAGSSIISGMCGVIIERIWATKTLEFYEKNSSLSFVGILILSSWIIGIICSYLMFYSFLGVYLWILIILSLIIMVGIGYFYIKRVNFRKLRKSKLPNRYTLSQTYQLKENIRVIAIVRSIAKIMIKTMSVLLIIVTCGTIIQSHSNIYLIRAVINIGCAVGGPVVILTLIREVYVWRQELKELLRYIFTFRRRNVVKPIENLDGRRLAFDTNQETDIYFQQLNDAWK